MKRPTLIIASILAFCVCTPVQAYKGSQDSFSEDAHRLAELFGLEGSWADIWGFFIMFLLFVFFIVKKCWEEGRETKDPKDEEKAP